MAKTALPQKDIGNNTTEPEEAASRGKDWSALKFPKGKRKSVFTGMDSPVTILEQEIVSLWKSKVENVWEIGNRLITLKKQLDVGHSKKKKDFKRTVEERLPFSYSTATNYKNVAERFESPEDAALFDSKAMYALASSQYPSDLREFIIEDAKKEHPEGHPYTSKYIKFVRELHEAEEESPHKDDENTTFSEHLETIIRVRVSLSDVVDLLKEIKWPEEPLTSFKNELEAIAPLIKKIAWELRPVPQKSNRRTFRR